MIIHLKLYAIKIIQVKISAYVFVDISKTIPYVISIYVKVFRHIDTHTHICMGVYVYVIIY